MAGVKLLDCVTGSDVFRHSSVSAHEQSNNIAEICFIGWNISELEPIVFCIIVDVFFNTFWITGSKVAKFWFYLLNFHLKPVLFVYRCTFSITYDALLP